MWLQCMFFRSYIMFAASLSRTLYSIITELVNVFLPPLPTVRTYYVFYRKG